MKKSRFLIALVVISAVVVSSGCVQNSDPHESDGKIDVLVSILPQKEFVRSVGGDHVKVTELISPGASPATYELTPTDAVNIENADIYFRIGHIPFEKAHISRIESMNPDMLIIDTSEGIALRNFSEGEAHSHDHEEHDEEHGEEHEEHDHEEEHGDEDHDEDHEEDNHEEGEHSDDEHDHDHEGVDPHIWLSPKNAIIQVETVYETLSEYDPENADEYRENADAYIARLNSLDAELKQTLSGISTKKMMVFHPAWGYLADEYGFEQLAIENEGKDPTAQELVDIIVEALENDIKVIFVQEQFSTEIAQSVAEQIGGTVVKIDPLAENYIENLQQVGESISSNLE